MVFIMHNTTEDLIYIDTDLYSKDHVLRYKNTEKINNNFIGIAVDILTVLRNHKLPIDHNKNSIEKDVKKLRWQNYLIKRFIEELLIYVDPKYLNKEGTKRIIDIAKDEGFDLPENW